MSLPPPDQSSPLVPGFRLDRYELLSPIAQGGMASVWIARLIGKHGFEKLFAVKTILPQFATDHRFQRMFLDEAHIASSIEHTNVAQILDLGEQHDVLYIVMEWVDGDAISKLQRAVEKKNLAIPPALALRMMADVCGGLHAAHELRGKDGELLGVVHRDVSPQNILINTKGIAKLIDFGIAKARDRFGGDTNAGVLKGKIAYMAPEQAVGKSIDRRADVWAVGAILYHLLAGKPPYDAPNQLATLHKLASGRPPLPLSDRLPKPIVDVVRGALMQDPDKRIGTAAELQNAIEAAMQAAGLRATTGDIALFMREHLGDRAVQRKAAIDLALQAAAERARVAQVLRMPGADSSSGIVDAAALLATELPKLAASSQSLPSHASVTGPGTQPGTLATTSLEPQPAVAPAHESGKKKWIAVAAIAAIVVAVGGIAISRRATSPGTNAAPETHAVPTATGVAPTASTAAPAPTAPTASSSAEMAASAPATGSATTASAAPSAQKTAAVAGKLAKPASSAKPSGPAKPKTVDDGF